MVVSETSVLPRAGRRTGTPSALRERPGLRLVLLAGILFCWAAGPAVAQDRDDAAVEGKPCNSLCRRWMGLEQAPPSEQQSRPAVAVDLHPAGTTALDGAAVTLPAAPAPAPRSVAVKPKPVMRDASKGRVPIPETRPRAVASATQARDAPKTLAATPRSNALIALDALPPVPLPVIVAALPVLPPVPVAPSSRLAAEPARAVVGETTTLARTPEATQTRPASAAFPPAFDVIAALILSTPRNGVPPP